MNVVGAYYEKIWGRITGRQNESHRKAA
jgi:hypothetical protein